MYYAIITRTYSDQIPEKEEFENSNSIEVGDKVSAWVGELLTTWSGEWEVTTDNRVGHVEQSASMITGKRILDEDGSNRFPIHFEIHTGGN